MSWLGEAEHVCEYTCSNKHKSYWQGDWDKKPETLSCDECKEHGKYSGFVPFKVGGMSKISFDQNGRQAYKFVAHNGEVSYISKAKYHLLETGKVKDFYTKGYTEKVRNEEETHNRRAKVTLASARLAFLNKSKV